MKKSAIVTGGSRGIGLGIVRQLAGVVYLPFLQKLFKTVSLSADHWLPVAGFSMLAPIVSSFLTGRFKYFYLNKSVSKKK
jgi:hypothetical protein